MKPEFVDPPSDPAPEMHEAALFRIAARLAAMAKAWREETTVTLLDPCRFLEAVESHFEALNSHVRAELTKTTWQPFSTVNSKE